MTTKLDKNKIKCAVFDLDGTLLNTIKTINFYLNSALNMNGLPSVDEDHCRSFVGDGAVKLIERALDFVGDANRASFKKTFDDYNKLYNSDPYYLTQPYEGIRDMLLCLKEREIKLAVLSNKPNFATKAAVEHFLPGMFDIVLGQRDGVALKPAPDALFSIMDELSVAKDETAYIGDAEPDVMTAKNASVALGVSVLWGFRNEAQLSSAGAEIFVHSPMQVVDLIKG